MIGYEFEFLIREGDHPLTRAIYKKFHQELEQRGWIPTYDPGTGGLTGSKKDGFYVTTDDGVCLMEINTPPQDTIQKCDRQIRHLLIELQSIYRLYNCSIIGVSAFPGPFDSPRDYLCYKSYIKYYNPTRFKAHWQDLLAIASHHVWLDVNHEQLLRQWQFFNRLTPILIALFANGPIFNQQKLDVLDGRDTLWHNMLDTSTIQNDSQYFAMPKVEFATLCDYFEFMLSMPFYYTLRDGKGISLVDKQITYKQFFVSKEMRAMYFDNTPVVLSPTIDDFFRIQQITFPHARIKYKMKPHCEVGDVISALTKKEDGRLLKCFDRVFLECRAIGAQPEADISAGPAFLLGVQTHFEQARQILNVFHYDDLLNLYSNALHAGLANQNLCETAHCLLECADAGLRQRGYGEEIFLQPLFHRVQKQANPASEIVQMWQQNRAEAVYKNRDFSC